MKKWDVSDISRGKYLGLIELGEDHIFEVIITDSKLVFGGFTNTGFIESGYMPIDNCFSLDENLETMVDDLKVYYSQGKDFTEFLICNDRM